MEGAKKVVWAVIVIVVIIVAIIFTVRRSGKPDIERPAGQTGKMVEMIDAKSGELITKTQGEWDELDYDHFGRIWKNTDTGEFTVVKVIICPHCGEKIPDRLVTVEDLMDPGTMDIEVRMEADMAYACPKCGGCPFDAPMMR